MDPRAVNIYRRTRRTDGLLFNSWRTSGRRSHFTTNYTSPVGFIAVIAEVTHDRRSSFCSRFQSGRLYAARRPTHAQALPLLPTGRPGLAFFALGVWPGRGRRTTTNSELPSAEYLGSIFVFLGSSWQNENELLGQTELRGTVRFFPANLRSPPVQMQR